MARSRRIANAIKDTGASKPTARRVADRTRPGEERKPVRASATGQGGSRRKGGGTADTAHPSQRGGVKPDAAGEERLGNRPRTRRSGEKRTPGTGLVKGPSRSRPGSPSTIGGRTRTGSDRGGPQRRGRARSRSRTKGRG